MTHILYSQTKTLLACYPNRIQELMINMKAILANIRTARLNRNYSQDYLAMKLNLSQNGYSKIELGYTQLALEKFLIIADLLEIDIIKLLENNGDLNALQVANFLLPV